MLDESNETHLLESLGPKKWLVTGAAGFIGSHLVETLLNGDQEVVALDNLATGSNANFDAVRQSVGEARWKRFSLINGDIRDLSVCRVAAAGVDYVLHQAALGSVPRSIDTPYLTTDVNVSGFVNMITAAKDSGVKRFVFASSSSVYGSDPRLPKTEGNEGEPLSPYALSKSVNEQYSAVFSRCYQMESIGLRYFNVFGPRQNPAGPYAAVIPLWFQAMVEKKPIFINGDGTTSRDFCFVANVVQANLLAATSTNAGAAGQCYNIACGDRTSLNQLAELIGRAVSKHGQQGVMQPELVYRDFRPGDVAHSHANIEKATVLLGYSPRFGIKQGLDFTAEWFFSQQH